jgi:hypothetical protein
MKLGVGLFPYLIFTFYYLPPPNDVKFISTILDPPTVAIFQVISFRKSYFNDPWILPSSLTSMEGVWNLGMDIPLSTTKVHLPHRS